MEIIVIFVFYFFFIHLSTSESDKAYHAGNSLSSSGHESGPHGITELSKEITANPRKSEGNASVLGTITTTTAAENVVPPVLILMIFQDAVPYSTVEKKADYIKKHVMKNDTDETRQNIIVSDVAECIELTEEILEKSGLGIVDTLDLLEQRYTEASHYGE